jgi:hypothetical protein
MSPHRNWDSPNPYLASECAHPPRNGGGGAHSSAGEGLGESQFRRLEKKLSTLPALWIEPKRLWYRQPDALTTQLDLIHYILSVIIK